MVEGSVPRIPPAFVPNFSAIIVINMTIRAERIKGRIDWKSISSIVVNSISLFNFCMDFVSCFSNQ